jgi:hypothetical protein
MKWTDEDLDLALGGLRDEELAPGAVEAVRKRVREQIEKPRFRWWVWSWVPALAAALAVFAVMPGRETAVEPPPLLARAPASPVVEPLVKKVFRAAPTRVAAPGRVAAETEFVKLVTDDPNVVILWAMNSRTDSKGEER